MKVIIDININQMLNDIKRWFNNKVVNKYRHIRTSIISKKSKREQDIRMQALGTLVFKFEPLFIEILKDSIKDYEETIQQNHYTLQTSKGIMKAFKSRLEKTFNS
jgi:hypothetical protein